MPTENEVIALRLRREGKSDREIAAAMGLKHRQSANRMINRGKRRLRAVLSLCSGDACSLLATLCN